MCHPAPPSEFPLIHTLVSSPSLHNAGDVQRFGRCQLAGNYFDYKEGMGRDGRIGRDGERRKRRGGGGRDECQRGWIFFLVLITVLVSLSVPVGAMVFTDTS